MRTSSLAGLCTLLGLAAGIGIGHYAIAPGGGAISQSSGPAAPPSRSDTRTPRSSSGRGAGAGMELEDLTAMLHRGRSSIAGARLQLALENQPPAHLRELALQVRETILHGKGTESQNSQLQDSILKAWAAAAPEQAVEFVNGDPSRNNRQDAYLAVFSTLGEIDPHRAVELARGLPDRSSRVGALCGACEALSERDPRLAFELFGDSKELSPSYRATMLSNLAIVAPEEAARAMEKVPLDERRMYWSEPGIFSAWAGKDPEAVMAWAGKTSDLALRNSAMKAVCARLAADSPTAAMQRIDALPADQRGFLIQSVMEVWADRDFKGALEAATALSKPSDRETALSPITGQIESLDPAMALQATMQMPYGGSRDNALDYLGTALTGQTPAEQDASLEKFSGPDRARLTSSLAKAMIATDPQRAVDLYSLIDPTQREGLSSSFGYYLAAKDPDLALTFAANPDFASERDQTVSYAFQQLVQISPASAAARLEKLTDPHARESALQAVASTWAQNDPAGAATWAETLSGNERMTLLSAVLVQQSSSDPEAASARLTALAKEPDASESSDLQSSASSIASQWASRDPDATAAWVASMPAGRAAESGASALIQRWAAQDMAAAATWLGQLPAGSVRDSGICAMAGLLTSSDPASAFNWSLSVSDSNQRDSSAGSILYQWAKKDPAAAKAALDHARLSPEDRESYGEMMK